jgi:hypothetical protein
MLVILKLKINFHIYCLLIKWWVKAWNSSGCARSDGVCLSSCFVPTLNWFSCTSTLYWTSFTQDLIIVLYFVVPWIQCFASSGSSQFSRCTSLRSVIQHDLNQFESEMKQRYNGVELISSLNEVLPIQTVSAQLSRFNSLKLPVV